MNGQKGRLGHFRCVVAELSVVQDGSGPWALEMVFELGRGKQIIKGSYDFGSKCKRPAIHQTDVLQSLALWQCGTVCYTYCSVLYCGEGEL